MMRMHSPAHLHPGTAAPGRLVDEVRARRPLVQCLTNTVTTGLVANALLAVGASPAMADVPGEAGVLAGSASSVLVNVGTPSAEQRTAMIEAASAAHAAGTPWVLDPVGVGLLPVRTGLAAALLELHPTVVRGNASEVRALAGAGGGAHGVDAVDAVDDVRDAAVALAAATGAVVAVSGPVDLVTNGRSVVRIANGDPLLTAVTGAGCALGGVVAAFAGVGDDPFAATVDACATYAVAAELAAVGARGPGSFAVALLDALAGVDAAVVAERGRLS